MLNVCKHAIFTLFALTLIKKQCNAFQDAEMAKNVKKTKPIVMDKLENLNMTYYCKFQANHRVCSGHGRKKSLKFFYDIKTQSCRQFEYGNCDQSYNLFEKRHTCLDSCRDEAFATVSENATANVYCRYQPDFGDCDSYEPSFYYDLSERKCKGFAYSGCGGNRNRFASKMLCSDACEYLVRHKEVKE